MRNAQRVSVLYLMEGLTAAGVNLLQIGIFFYMNHVYGWGLKENLLLATAGGVVYVCGALLAGTVSHRLGRRRALVLIWLAMASAALVAALAADVRVLVGAILVHTVFNGLNWPALESLVSSGVDAHVLSRRLAIYNLVWSGSGAATIALSGSIIERAPGAYFFIVAAVHVLSALAMLLFYRAVIPAGAVDAHVTPEPELLRARTLALWLSRISLPATFMINYALMAMMPTLPVVEPLAPAYQTVVGSAWLVARWSAFLLLGWSLWWHTRPRALLAAAALMLVAFLGVTLPPSLVYEVGYATNLVSMLIWQVVLGLALGMIYTGSLYFGMVLSDGATEHGGYHEALIGLGCALGPGSALAAQVLRPGDLYMAIGAVAGIIGVTVAAAAAASMVIGRDPSSASPLPAPADHRG